MADEHGNIWSKGKQTRDVSEPKVVEESELFGKREEHPAFGMVTISHPYNANQVLFDSDIRHRGYVVLAIHRADRTRSLNRDRIHPRQKIVEVAMSEAQFARMLTQQGGTPATIQWDMSADDPLVDELPYAPRLAESLDEVRKAADEAMAKINEAFAAYKEKKSAANLRALEIALGHLPANLDFAARSLHEATEDVVQQARNDIEAMVAQAAERHGIEIDAVDAVPELAAASEDDQ